MKTAVHGMGILGERALAFHLAGNAHRWAVVPDELIRRQRFMHLGYLLFL
jgi:hypothetical protein